MHINRFLLVAVGVALLASACDSTATTTTTTTIETTTTSDPTTEPQASIPSNYAGYRSQPTACGAEQPAPVVPMEFAEPGDASVAGTAVVTLDTSCGPIVIELSPDVAPETTNSFVFLAESGYFDGSVSHRIIPGFMMQAGDPTATGLGGPGYTLPDEFPSEAAPYTRGVVAMANAGPGTTGSQFFIMFQDVDWLEPQYTIIGEVTSGLETLEQIAAVPLGTSASSPDSAASTPLESVYIVSVSVER
jgi:cyclophilin family peptidyl-prolyl cis-trans isomerase